MRPLVVLISLLSAIAHAEERACSEATLRAWQPGIGAVTVEQVKEEPAEPTSESRQASVKCVLSESEEACEARARKEVLAKNPTWTIVDARASGISDGYDAQLEADGQSIRRYFPTVDAVEQEMARLKSAGKKNVLLTKLHAVSKPETRTIEITARAPGKRRPSRTRLRARYRWSPTGEAAAALDTAMRAAMLASLSVALFERRDDGTFTIILACP